MNGGGFKQPRRVLIVEDEDLLRQNMVRSLNKLPDLDAVGAASVGDALGILDRQSVDLVISDIDLPDRLGIELIGELRSRGLETPIIFASAFLGAYQRQIPPSARVEVFEKPISMEKLRTIVQERLSALNGSANPFGVFEYLQLAGLGRHSIVLEVRGGANPGRIFLRSGEAWSAQDTYGDGFMAFRRLALSRGDAILCTTLVGEPGPRNLQGSIESLLLEAACRKDEASVALPEGEPSGAAEPDFEDLVDQGIALSMKKRYDLALKVFQEAESLRPGDRRVEANIERLADLLKPKP